MKTKPDIHRLIELQKLLMQFRAVQRVIHIPDSETEFENDTEHSYNLAIVAWYLSQYFPEIDTDKVIRLALAHDLVEIHAGDTFFYAHESVIADKKQREHQAYLQLQADWKDFPDMIQAIEEYEKRDTNESRFVYALDKVMPMMMIYLDNGRAWLENDVTFEMQHSRKKDKVALSPEVNQYYLALHDLLKEHPDYFAPVQQR